MKQQPVGEFQRANSRRLWFAAGLLLAIVLTVLMLLTTVVVIIARNGGTALLQRARLVQECARGHLLPVAAAAERYRRDQGHYPERIEAVYPVYLKNADALQCPADQGRRPGVSSFRYQPPDVSDPRSPMLICEHHGPVLLRAIPRTTLDPGQTEWQPHLQPRPETR